MCFNKTKCLTLLLAVMLLGMGISSAFAGVTQDKTVYYTEGSNYLEFYGTISMVADSIGKFYTQWIEFSNVAFHDAYMSAVCSNVTGTEDVNVYLQFARTPDSTVKFTTLSEDTLNDMDAVGITTKIDTLNIDETVSNLNFNAGTWIRFLFIGQASNPLTTISWNAKFRKPDNSATWGYTGDRRAFSIRNDKN